MKATTTFAIIANGFLGFLETASCLSSVNNHRDYFSRASPISRRDVTDQGLFWAALGVCTSVSPCTAGATTEPLEFLTGKVSLCPTCETSFPIISSNSNINGSIGDGDDSRTPALYITCRPDRPDNVPRAILDGSRGKPPPVLTKRIPNPTFPLDVRLTALDVTPEGNNNSDNDSSTIDSYWWMTSDDALIVSARWDDDGVAATRSPNDLVGRTTVLTPAKATAPFELELESRGAFGKFATKK